jgi:hypothetical protein
MTDYFGNTLSINDTCIKLDFDSYRGITLRLVTVTEILTRKVKIVPVNGNERARQVTPKTLIKSTTNIVQELTNG